MNSEKSKKVLTMDMLKNPVLFLAFGFGTGLAKKAPGTFGTLAALPFLWLSADWSTQNYIWMILSMSILGVVICGKASHILKVHDHGGIVWDEIVGYIITMFLVTITPTNLAIGFAYFRLFDIWKPWPIKWCDKNVQGGMGIMLDDILAGIIACLSTHLSIVYLLPILE